MIRKLAVIATVALSLTGCASANKRFEQGAQLQASGRHAEAAVRYIEALKKDSRLDSARAGLKAAGAAAIENWLATAAAPTTQPDAAAEQFIAIDDLSRRALEVGVFLVPPNDYDARKRTAFDKAIKDDIDDAPLLSAQRQYADAMNRLRRAATAYQPSADQATAIGNAGAQVSISWARADTTAGQFRTAYDRVAQLPNIPGLSRAMLDDVRALQAAALTRGTRRIAVIPPSATVNARRDLPEDALPALGDALLENPWASPPQFVAMISPIEVDQGLRRLGLARRSLTMIEAARVGRTVGADYVVMTEIDSVRREDSNVRVTRRPVRTRSGVDTAYYIEEGSARLFARATYLVVDREGNRLSDYMTVNGSASAQFSRVRFAGDYRTLDLRLGERDLFTRGADDRDLVRSFVASLSPRLGEAVFAEVVRRIP
jgi:tetratricopeptide (TPR) repeat protein